VGGREGGKHGRRMGKKALIAVAAQEDGRGIGRIRMRRIVDASAASLLAFIQDFIEPGSVVHTDAWLRVLGMEGLPPLDHLCKKRRAISVRYAATGLSSDLAAETLATGHSPGCRPYRSSGLLSGRVHLPIQSSEVPQPGQTVLSTAPTGCSRRTSNFRSHHPRSSGQTTKSRGYLSQMDTPQQDFLASHYVIENTASYGSMVVMSMKNMIVAGSPQCPPELLYPDRNWRACSVADMPAIRFINRRITAATSASKEAPETLTSPWKRDC
jgi:hypothetical protein